MVVNIIARVNTCSCWCWLKLDENNNFLNILKYFVQFYLTTNKICNNRTISF